MRTVSASLADGDASSAALNASMRVALSGSFVLPPANLAAKRQKRWRSIRARQWLRIGGPSSRRRQHVSSSLLQSGDEAMSAVFRHAKGSSAPASHRAPAP
jgi:glycerol-3-phosphate O-acyltransferase